MPTSLKEDNRPATLWYWDDWFSSFDVRTCSLAARGLWIDMLGIMARAEIKGTLTIAGKQINGKYLAKLCGVSNRETGKLIKELEDNKVFSRLDDGTIINRRMYGESRISKARSEAGKKGAETRWQSDSKEDNKENDKSMSGLGNGNDIDLSLNKKRKRRKSEGRKREGIKIEENNKILTKVFGQIDINLCNLLIDLILKNDPKSKVKKISTKTKETWLIECRRLREIDERTPEEIEEVIRFSQEDDFWKGNILSMPTLRKNFGQLWLKAHKKINGQPQEDLRKKREQQAILSTREQYKKGEITLEEIRATEKKFNVKILED